MSSNATPLNEVVLAEPRGFCAGVDRAIDIVERALQKFGRPIYVRHEIVHNTFVVNDLKAKGAIFIEDLADVPPGSTLVFSAHGVPKAVEIEAAERGFAVFDATCPLVTKVHVEVAKLAKEGYEFIMIGHKGHPEVEGTMGQLSSGIHLVEDVADVAQVQLAQANDARLKLALVTQTTLSVDDAADITAAVKARFPFVRPNSKTFATPRKIDKTPSKCSAPRWTWWWWWVAPPAPTAIACANWPSAWAHPPTWSTPWPSCKTAGLSTNKAWG
jgi:4-hydroxy-3-methylbut-2-en-1-yl diphosphate reductase